MHGAGPDPISADNIPVRGLEGSFADVDSHPGAFAREQSSFKGDEAVNTQLPMPDEPSEAAGDGQAVHPPTGVSLPLQL